MKDEQRQALIDYLEEFTTAERVNRIGRVLEKRTRWVTVVLEDIYHPHNASAVLRSCDCFGIQDVHVIENSNRFDPASTVSSGSDRWITVHRYRDTGKNNTERCFNRLRGEGYRIVAMTPHERGVPVGELPVDERTALVFGTELEGLSGYSLARADMHAAIPMVGFNESLNLSVSAAVALFELTSRLRMSGIPWELAEREKSDLKVEWLRKSIRAGDRLIEKFREESG